MAKKQFNLDSLANELEQSAFFPSRQSPTPVPESSVEPADQSPHKKPVPPETRNPENPKTSNPPSLEIPLIPFQLDLSAKADQKYTSLFAVDEMELLDDIKLDVKRRFGYKTTKIDLLRCALGELIEDYQKHGNESRLVTRLKTRKPENK